MLDEWTDSVVNIRFFLIILYIYHYNKTVKQMEREVNKVFFKNKNGKRRDRRERRKKQRYFCSHISSQRCEN